MNPILGAIDRANSVLIIGHLRPDGDCLGSAFALREYCLKLGKIADVGSPTPIPDAYSFVRQSNVFNKITRKSYDLFIAVDCGSRDRIGRMEGFFKSAKETVWIDHHEGHNGFGKYNYVVPTASSTCELIFDILEPTKMIDSVIATYLYLGISTDTGHFMHNNTTPKVLYTAYKLALYGAECHELAVKLYRTRSKEKTALIAKSIDTLRYYLGGTVGIIAMTRDILESCNIEANDTEGIIDYAIAVEGVKIGVSICEEKPNEFKVSFRSRGERNVDEVARIFGGGGHINASGCRINGKKEDVIDKILKAIRDTEEV